MNISFDLDSTIIPNGNEFRTEKRNKIAKLLGIEKIRKGTPYLISELKNNGHKIHIYTTSFRKKIKIRLTLLFYGIYVNKIINQSENQKILKELNIHSSKYPTAFKFDIHVDDLKGVGIEGEKYNFKTIIIKPSDESWYHKILEIINKESQFSYSIKDEKEIIEYYNNMDMKPREWMAKYGHLILMGNHSIFTYRNKVFQIWIGKAYKALKNEGLEKLWNEFLTEEEIKTNRYEYKNP